MEGPPKLDPAWSREADLRRDARRRWYHEGVPIQTPAIERAFDRWIDRGPDGRYRLENEINWVYCEIEGPPVFVERAEVQADRVRLTLSDGRTEWLRPETLRQGPEGELYCQVREGRLPAAFERAAMPAFESLLAEDGEGLFLRLGGRAFRPRVVATPLEWGPDAEPPERGR